MGYSVSRTIVTAPGQYGLQYFPIAEPDDVLDYTLDFSAWISDYGGDTINQVTLSLKPSGASEAQITNVLVDATNFLIHCNIGNGIAGRAYIVRFEVLMNSGRNFEFLVAYIVDGVLAVFPPIYPTSLDFGNIVGFYFDPILTLNTQRITIGGRSITL